MFQYIVSLVISVVIYLAIQYYFNNYSSLENKEFFYNGYNKYYIFITLFIIINTIMYFYFNNSFLEIINKSESSVSNVSNVGGSDLKSFENNFVNNIKNQEVDVGLAPF